MYLSLSRAWLSATAPINAAMQATMLEQLQKAENNVVDVVLLMCWWYSCTFVIHDSWSTLLLMPPWNPSRHTIFQLVISYRLKFYSCRLVYNPMNIEYYRYHQPYLIYLWTNLAIWGLTSNLHCNWPNVKITLSSHILLPQTPSNFKQHVPIFPIYFPYILACWTLSPVTATFNAICKAPSVGFTVSARSMRRHNRTKRGSRGSALK